MLFFGNSNIFPEAEADARFAALQKVANHFSLAVIRRTYDHDSWLKLVAGHEADPERGERCSICFACNLREAAEEARRLGILHFTTTLTVSPHKSSSTIFSLGRTWDEFVEIDLKKRDGFRRSIELSKELDLYRQDYCGCEFSLR